jgi:DDE superfamily endonuclease
VVDRGFRDCISVMQALGLDVMMPPFLSGRRQFSTEEANQSRCITKIRWVVEVANRRVKQFKYFANTVQNSSLPYLQNDLSFVCAVINRYQRPMNMSKPQDLAISRTITNLLYQKNQIQLVNIYET